MSDADEGPKWLLDRWHIVPGLHTLAGEDQLQYRRIIDFGLESAERIGAGSIAPQRLEQTRLREFSALFETCWAIEMASITGRASLCICVTRRDGRSRRRARPGWRILKEIEVQINRSFKGQGDSWSSRGAEHLAYQLCFQSDPNAWDHR